MPRYFFHVRNDIVATDKDGMDLPNDAVALERALDGARDLASASVRQGHLDLRHYVECVAEGGRKVGIVRFADAVKIIS